MIINSEGGVKQTIGQTTEYKTTIDVENLAFITTLLSSNLYSNPEDSFIREIVSNGWDSHVEAGNTDTPLLVRIKRGSSSYNSYDITIRDYGTGLSKEQFENLFCKIGSSTKRESNAYLGAFGLGHLSPLAVSKVCYINSYYNGIVRLYIMTKDGNNITTNLVSEQPTNEHNGLEITVKNINNITAYEKSITNLAFFPNVFVDGVYNTCNAIKVKRFKHFSFANHCFQHKILLGNVLYPLDINIIPSELINFYTNLNNSGLVFNFSIGELNVTPNRESIIYNSKVNNIIINRIKEAKAEIEEILKPIISGDYTDPIEYHNISSSNFKFNFIENKQLPSYSDSYSPIFNIKWLDLPVTFYGKKVNPQIVAYAGKIRPSNTRAVSDGDRMWKDKFPWQANRILDNNKTSIIVLNQTEKISKYIKEYLIENYNTFIICSEFNKADFTNQFIKQCLRWNQTTLTNEEQFIVDKCWEFMQKRFIKIDFSSDKKFLDFKEKLKKEAKDCRVVLNEKIILTVMKPGASWAHKVDFRNYQEALKWIKALKTGVIIRNLDTMQIGSIASRLGYATVAANKKVVDLLNKEPLKCKISQDTVLNHPLIKKFVSLYKSNLYFVLGKISDVSFRKTLPKELQDVIVEALSIRDKLSNYYMKEIIEAGNMDEDFYNSCVTIKECYTSYGELLYKLELENLGHNLSDLVSYIIMKNKLYKISYDCYKKMKENKLLKAICEQ